MSTGKGLRPAGGALYPWTCRPVPGCLHGVAPRALLSGSPRCDFRKLAPRARSSSPHELPPAKEFRFTRNFLGPRLRGVKTPKGQEVFLQGSRRMRGHLAPRRWGHLDEMLRPELAEALGCDSSLPLDPTSRANPCLDHKHP